MALADLNKSPRCQHVHYSGRPCKAPARRGRNYCVFHQAAHLDPGGCVLPIVEDLHSYQLAIIRIARALADDVIDSRKATALLYALQLAGSKLEAFAKQRAEIERPAVALKKEINERYDARRLSFPWIPDQDLRAILNEMRSEQPSEPNHNVEPVPQKPPCTATDRGTGSTVPQGRLAGSPGRSPGNPNATTDGVPEGRTDVAPATSPQPTVPSSDFCPPRDDSGRDPGITAAGAA